MILAAVHTVIVLAAFFTGEMGRTFINGPAWVLFGVLDYPESWLLWKQSIFQPPIFFLGVGIFHWGLIGLGIQSFWNLSRTEKAEV